MNGIFIFPCNSLVAFGRVWARNKQVRIRVFLVVTLYFLSSVYAPLHACSCSRGWNDSFIKTAKSNELVALVKVISFDDYLEKKYLVGKEAIPYSMTVEIIKKYKGAEKRKRITIYGDNGILCRPYLNEFKLNAYYLIAPVSNTWDLNNGYEFFVCRTDYLLVDFPSQMASGNYSFARSGVSLSTFERHLKYGNWDFEILLVVCVLISMSVCIRWMNKRRITRMHSKE